jgi:hypothetical protein
MSATITYSGVAVALRDSRTNDRDEKTAPAEATAPRFTNEPLGAGEPPAVDEFVARVLGHAHRHAFAEAAPDEARVILHLAHLFADELAKADREFDRERFIETATEEPA